ncbi:hypothetical protein CsatA_021313 [Cannabis sativa]
MDWKVLLTEVAVDIIFEGSPLEENVNSTNSSSFGLLLLTYFLEHQKDNRATKKANAPVPFDQIDAHFYLIFSVTLFWLNVKNRSLYQVLLWILWLSNSKWLYLVLLCVYLITTGIFIFANYKALQLLDNDIKWIRRESRLLRANLDDAEGIKSLRSLIDQTTKERQPPDSGLNSSNSTDAEAVREAENDVFWVKETKNVVDSADKLVKDFECRRLELMLKRISLCLLSVIKNLSDTAKLCGETIQVTDGINSSLTKKMKSKFHSCESLEKSWSVIRTLLERPIEEHESKLVNYILQVGAGGIIASTLNKVEAVLKAIDQKELDSINGQSIKLQLMLLCPFLQHIKGLRLESQIEMAWLRELDETVSEAKAAIDTLLKVSSCKCKWLRIPNVINVWKAKQTFKEDMKYIDISFSDLLEQKEKYGFTFIIRDSSKSKHTYYHNTDIEENFQTHINSIRSYLEKKKWKRPWVSEQLGLICDQLEKMPELLDNSNSTAAIQNIREVWLNQMENIVKTVVSSLKTFLESSESSNIVRKTRAWFQLSRHIDQIKHHICVLERSIIAYSGELKEESSSVVGLEEDVEAVVTRLTANITERQDCNNNFDVFSIVGRKGIGKTTLAKKICSHRAVVAHFPIRVWLSGPQNWNLSSLNDIKVQVLGQPELVLQEKEDDFEYFKQRMHNLLAKDKYILILDNVSTLEAMDTLMEKLRLPETEGRKILLTSRNENLASEDDHHTIHRLRLRTKDESLSLLKQMVYISSSEETTALEIVRRCSGLPLSIVHVGYMMLMQDATASEALAKLSTCDFVKSGPKKCPGHLQKLLEHFEIFPVDCEIPARRLVALWVSEGLVELSGDNNETIEQVAEKRLSELIDQGIVQTVKRKTSGKVKACRLPFTGQPLNALPRQTMLAAHRLAHHYDKNGISFCLIHSDNGSTHDEQGDYRKLHSFLRFDTQQDDEPRDNIGFFLPADNEHQDGGSTTCRFKLGYKNLRSFLTFDPREGEEPGETIGNFLCKGIQRGRFQQLLVLDLEGVFKPEIPNTIAKLRRLKYLGLRWTYLQKIPSCIGNLVHLETLDVKYTYVHSLPSSIWKLQRLRNLYLHHNNRCKLMNQPRGLSFKKLQTLWGVFLDKDSPLKDCLDKSNDLRKLAMVFHLDKNEQKSLSSRMSKLNRLQTLRLRSIDETGKPNTLFLSPSSLNNLSRIELFGKIEDTGLIDELTCVHKLTEITLSASALTDDPMPKLGKLPNLKQLYLYSDSCKKASMVCKSDGFPQLLDLKIWKINDLKELIIEEKALQKLRDLEIRGCERLEVPDGLKNLKTLAELKLTDMPEEFSRKIVRDKMLIWGDITQSPLINILDKDS